MPKVSDTYASLVRGVSQQTPEMRLPGQHGEQLNMLSDPVRGLTRRDGSVRIAEEVVRPAGTDPAAFIEDLSANFTEYTIKVEDQNYLLCARRPGTTGEGDHIYMTSIGGADDGSVVPVSLTATAAALAEGGINSVAVAGGYVLLAHNSTVLAVESDDWDTNENLRRGYISVRGGTYSQTYRVSCTTTVGAQRTIEYTTPTSSYPGVLDTSDISYGASDYAKQVNDRVNDYNTRVNQWIGTAAEAILPQNIAQKLYDLMIADGWEAALGFDGSSGSIRVEGGVILLEARGSQQITQLAADDHANNAYMKAAWKSVKDPDELPPIAHGGAVIEIAPTGEDSYYLKAELQSSLWSVAAVFPGKHKGGRVVWKEAPATTTNVQSPFLVGAFESGVLHIGSTPSDLDLAIGGSAVPLIGQRVAGDQDSSPLPHFCGRKVNHLAMFQDRLLVFSDNVTTASRIGDYFNFFRASALTVTDDDAVEVFATGSEDDDIVHSVFFDRSLVLFGNLQQYVLSGKLPFTPSTAAPTQSSAHRGAASIKPLAHGDNVFFTKAEGGRSKVHQISVGAADDTSASVEITQQLDDYIRGHARALVGVSMPDTLVLRTDDSPHRLYAYRYLDAANGERLLDAWHTYEFAEGCGSIMAIYPWNDRLRILFARDTPSGVALVTDELRLAAGSKVRPHLDSQSYHTGREILPGMQCAWGDNAVATRAWQGREDGDIAALFEELGEDAECIVGFPFPAYSTLTNPVRRDRNDNPRLFGRLVINRLLLSHANTGAYAVDIETPYGDFRALAYDGNQLDAIDALIGVTSLHEGQATATIGRERREYTAHVRAIKWLPVSITNISWVGQDFNRTN